MVLVMVAAGALMLACSQDEQGQDAAQISTVYDGWKNFTYGAIRLHFPDGHVNQDKMNEAAQSFAAVRRRDALFLGLPEPVDTVDIMYYTGYGHGRKVTGLEYPGVINDTIHFWLPSFYGPVMARYMINQWQPGGTRFPFLKEGIITLLDFSGQNHHQRTLDLIGERKFMSLLELSMDTTVNSNLERIQSAEAASFVDFVVFNYGSAALGALYTADVPFSVVVNGLFSVSVDSLQMLWLQTAARGAGLDTTGTR